MYREAIESFACKHHGLDKALLCLDSCYVEKLRTPPVSFALHSAVSRPLKSHVCCNFIHAVHCRLHVLLPTATCFMMPAGGQGHEGKRDDCCCGCRCARISGLGVRREGVCVHACMSVCVVGSAQIKGGNT